MLPMRFPIHCLLLCIFAPGCSTVAPPVDHSALLDGAAAERFWELQDQIATGEWVGDNSWDAMFATPAYQWQASDEEARDNIRLRMRTAFVPDRSFIEKSAYHAQGYTKIRWQHFMLIRDQRADLELYYQQLHDGDIIREALTLVQEYLPPNTVQLESWTMPVRLLFFGPDAFAGEDAIYVDLLHAMERDDEFVLLLAHEFHHEYYAQLTPFAAPDADAEFFWLMHAMQRLHQEGVADLIDKRNFPLKSQKGLSRAYIANFNQYYRDARRTLKQFDDALLAMSRADGDRSELARNAWKLLHYGAHPEGFYMADVIRKAQGRAALLEDIGNPFAFIRRFQSVDPVFSDEAMAFLDALEVDAPRLTGAAEELLLR